MLNQLKSFNWTKKNIIFIGALLVFLIAGLMYFFMSPSNELQPVLKFKEERRVAVEVKTVELDKISKNLTAVGTLVAYQSVVIKSDLPGRVKEVFFKEGGDVKKDDVLIELDDELNKIDVKSTEAKYQLSKSEFERAQELHGKQYLSSKESEKALSNLKLAEAELEGARLKLSRTKLKAPFDGVVGIMKDVGTGTYLAPNQDLVTIVSVNPMKVDFKVPGSYLKSVMAGQKVKVFVDGFDKEETEGQIDAIDSKVDALGHSLLVRATIPNASGHFKPGLFARVSIVIGENDKAVVIPETAIERNGNQEFVYTVVQGAAVMTPIVTGVKENGRVEVLNGLKEKDTIVIAGTVRDGYQVKIVKSLETPKLKKEF